MVESRNYGVKYWSETVKLWSEIKASQRVILTYFSVVILLRFQWQIENDWFELRLVLKFSSKSPLSLIIVRQNQMW